MRLPAFLNKGGFKPGAIEDFPRGSVDRAKALTVALVSSWSLASTTQREWQCILNQAKKEQAAALLVFEDFDAYLTASVGETEGESVKKFEAKATKQGERTDFPTVGKLSQSNRAKENGVSAETQRWLDRLARDYPDLLKKVNAGELKPKTAARQAGIIRVPSPLEQAKKAYGKLSAKERQEMRTWQDAQDAKAPAPKKERKRKGA
jgi:hypothetical protein